MAADKYLIPEVVVGRASNVSAIPVYSTVVVGAVANSV